MLLKITRIVLLNHNTCTVQLFYRLHSYIAHIVIVTIHYHRYCPRIIPAI